MDFPPARWRLVWEPEPQPGPWNMAVDEALLVSVVEGASPPVLRLYAWDPPCLSLGIAQPFADVDETRLRARGWDVVRRPTGGRAILHTDELTYAVLAPMHEPRVQGDVLDAYYRLAQGLLAGLKRLGLPVSLERQREAWQRERENPVCFHVPAVYEITVAGKKILGSAQSRKLRGVLQHGTLPLTGDITRILDVLAFPSEEAREIARRRLRERAATLHDLLGREVSWEEAAHALVEGFRQALNITFEEQPLTREERARVQALVESKYASEAWLRRK